MNGPYGDATTLRSSRPTRRKRSEPRDKESHRLSAAANGRFGARQIGSGESGTLDGIQRKRRDGHHVRSPLRATRHSSAHWSCLRQLIVDMAGPPTALTEPNKIGIRCTFPKTGEFGKVQSRVQMMNGVDYKTAIGSVFGRPANRMRMAV